MRGLDIFSPVSLLMEDAEKEIDAWAECNRNLQKDIDDLRQLVKVLTKNAQQIHSESNKPREVVMSADPEVKLRVGNTRNIISLYEQSRSKPGLPTGATHSQRSSHVVSHRSKKTSYYKIQFPEIRFSSPL